MSARHGVTGMVVGDLRCRRSEPLASPALTTNTVDLVAPLANKKTDQSTFTPWPGRYRFASHWCQEHVARRGLSASLSAWRQGPRRRRPGESTRINAVHFVESTKALHPPRCGTVIRRVVLAKCDTPQCARRLTVRRPHFGGVVTWRGRDSTVSRRGELRRVSR